MIGRRRREEDADISEFPSPSVKAPEHFHQCSVKVDGGYDKIETVTVCGKQRKDEPFRQVAFTLTKRGFNLSFSLCGIDVEIYIQPVFSVLSTLQNAIKPRLFDLVKTLPYIYYDFTSSFKLSCRNLNCQSEVCRYFFCENFFATEVFAFLCSIDKFYYMPKLSIKNLLKRSNFFNYCILLKYVI